MQMRGKVLGYNGATMQPDELNQLGSYGPWAQAASSRPGRFSFATAMKSGKIRLAEWKKQGRARVRDCLGPSPTEGKAPRAQQVRTLIREDFTAAFQRCDALLTPTLIYARPIRMVQNHYKVKNVVHGIAHITGGGMLENIERHRAKLREDPQQAARVRRGALPCKQL